MRKRMEALVVAIACVLFLMVPTLQANAAELTIGFSSASVKIGDTVTVTVMAPSDGTVSTTLTYDGGLFESPKSAGQIVENGAGSLGVTFNKSIDITFKAKAAGTGKFSAAAVNAQDANGAAVTYDGAGARLTVSGSEAGADAGAAAGTDTTNSNIDTTSADNSLASIKLSSGTLSPAFQYNVTNYTATVDYSVTKLDVDAVCSNKSATIESMTGNDNLQVGENTISIVVKAGNGAKATYRIKVTRSSEQGNDTTAQKDESKQENKTEETKTEEAKTEETKEESQSPAVNEAVGTGNGEFTVGDVVLVPAEDLPQEIIPADFSINKIAFDSVEYPCLRFDKGDLVLLYLVEKGSKDKKGTLYIYDQNGGEIYSFVKLESEYGYVIALKPEAASVPEGFESVNVSIEGKGSLKSFQSPDYSNEYFLFQAFNKGGEKGWYWFESSEGTYQKAQLNAGVSKEDVEAMQKAQSELQTKLDAAKAKNRYYVIGMVMGFAILIVIIVNLLLSKKDKDDNDETESDFSEVEEKSATRKKGGLFGLFQKDDDEFWDEDKSKEVDEEEILAEEIAKEEAKEQDERIEKEIQEKEQKHNSGEAPFDFGKIDVESDHISVDRHTKEKMHKPQNQEAKSSLQKAEEMEDFMDAILAETMEEMKADLRKAEKVEMEKAPELNSNTKKSEGSDEDLEFLDI